MTCEQHQHNLHVYAELSDEERRSTDEHVATCEACQHVQSQMLKIAHLSKTLGSVRAVPENAGQLTHRILARVAQEQRQHYSWTSLLSRVMLQRSWTVVAAALVIWFGIEYSRPYTMSTPPPTVQSAVILDTRAFRTALHQRRSRGSRKPCTSPLLSAAEKLNCLKEKYQSN